MCTVFPSILSVVFSRLRLTEDGQVSHYFTLRVTDGYTAEFAYMPMEFWDRRDGHQSSPCTGL